MKLTRKTALKQIVKTLESHLGDLHMAIGEKKFNRRVRKASKILATGLPKEKTKKIKTKKIVLETTEQESPTDPGIQMITGTEGMRPE